MSREHTKWRKNVKGELEMPPIQAEFLDWLLDPVRVPATQKEWAAAHDISTDTVMRWKRDKRFIDEWEERARRANMSVERVQAVIDTLHKQAVSGDVRAANLYLQYVDKFTPKQRVVSESDEVAAMSDEALTAELRQLLSDV